MLRFVRITGTEKCDVLRGVNEFLQSRSVHASIVSLFLDYCTDEMQHASEV